MQRSCDPIDLNSLTARAEQMLLEHHAIRRVLRVNVSKLSQLRKRLQEEGHHGRNPTDGRSGRQSERVSAKTNPASSREELKELTNREREVLRLIVDGLSTKELAFKMNITFKTAACHRCNLMRKLNVREMASMVRIAIRNGLVEA